MPSDDALSRLRPYYPAPSSDPVSNTDTRLVWLNPSVTVLNAVATASWTAVDCTDSVPHGAVQVLLECECSKSGGTNSRLDFRQRSGRPTVLGLTATATDVSGSQVTVAVLDTALKRSFDYQVTGASFGTSLTVKILGYYKA